MMNDFIPIPMYSLSADLELEFERDLAILEEEMFLNDYFNKHGVFTIEDS